MIRPGFCALVIITTLIVSCDQPQGPALDGLRLGSLRHDVILATAPCETNDDYPGMRLCHLDSLRVVFSGDTIRSVVKISRLDPTSAVPTVVWNTRVGPDLKRQWGDPDSVREVDGGITAWWRREREGFIAVAAVAPNEGAVNVVAAMARLPQSRIPDFWPTFGARSDPHEAYQAAVKSDLRNLVMAQQSYFSDHATYSSSMGRLAYTASSSVTVTLGPTSAAGWSATARYASSRWICGIIVGSGQPMHEGMHEGQPDCWNE